MVPPFAVLVMFLAVVDFRSGLFLSGTIVPFIHIFASFLHENLFSTLLLRTKLDLMKYELFLIFYASLLKMNLK